MKCKWLLTPDESFARDTDQSFQLASINDLHDWVAATSEVFIGILQVHEGKCKWTEYSTLDELGFEEYECGYELIE